MSDIAPTTAPAAPIATSEAPATEQMTPAEKKIWKLKVDGKEIDFDASDEEALKKHITKGLGADKRFEEAAAARREAAANREQAEEFLRILKTNPRQILENPNLGIDVRKLAQEIVWEQIQEEQLTPEQKMQRQRDLELEEFKRRDREREELETKTQQQKLETHYEAEFEKKIMSALELGGVPKTPGTVKRMAYYMAQSLEHDLDLQPEDLVQQVRKDYMNEHRELYQNGTPEALMSLAGEEFLKKLRDEDMKRLKSTQGAVFKTPEPKQSQKAPEKKRRLSGTDWRRQILLETGVMKRK